MHGNCWSLTASLAHPATLSKHGCADRTPTAAVLKVDSALPVAVLGSTIELGCVLTHTCQRTEHAGLTLKVTRWPVERDATPCADSGGAVAPARIGLADSPDAGARLAAELLLTVVPVKLRAALLASHSDGRSPSSKEVAFGTAIWGSASRVARELSSALPTCALPTPKAKPSFGAVWLKHRAAEFALARLKHEPIIACGFEISEDYCRIARERIARVEAQPNLFQPKAEQEPMFSDTQALPEAK